MQENPLVTALSGDRYIRDVDASGTSLVKANLKNLRGDAIRLCNTDLSGANLQEAHLVECDFSAAKLAEADFAQSVMRLCTFDSAYAANACLDRARIEDSSLRGADFSHARLCKAHLTESSLARACLRSADFTEAQGDGVEFRGADLTGASLKGVRLTDADFRGADLTGADFSGGDFSGSDFRGAILDNVRWEGAVVIGAKFDQEASIVQSSLDVSIDNTLPGNAGTGQDEAAADAITEFVLQFLTSSSAPSNRSQNLSKVTESLEAWRSRVGDARVGDIAKLFETIERSLAASGPWPPEAMNSFSGVLRSLETADDLEPPAEWKALLMQLFPTLANDEDGDTLDELASNLQAILKQPDGKGANG